MSSVRRLTAILAADVAGYSRLMGVDEEGTHQRLKAHRVALVDPKIAEHHGRIVKTTGDGLLVEFPSVVDAVRCAVDVQRGMVEQNAAIPADERIEFRIGINLGDVIAEGGDIFGDGVNIAARLEALAEPGGICVSRVVRDQVRDRLDYTFEDMGEQEVKNIARPVRVYALPPEGIAELPASSAPPAKAVLQPGVAPRLSIVVLPFTNLSDDREQQYFADGITEDLTTDLSRLAGMLVISRNTAFTYRNKQVDTKQIGRELGVRYVLEGSVRRSGNQVRVNTQLIDAEGDIHLWAERFDREMGDLLALQDEVTSRIAIALNLELMRAEAARPTESPDALDFILRGRAARAKGGANKSIAEAIGLFERALALDPRSVEAQSQLADALVQRGLKAEPDAERADFERAQALIGQALATSPLYPSAHLARAWLRRAQRRCEDAIPDFEAVLALDRNAVRALVGLGQCKFLTGGSDDEVIQLFEQAIRLSPRDPGIAGTYVWIGFVHFFQSRTDKAIPWLENARRADPRASSSHYFLAAAYGLKGELDRAAAELAEAHRMLGSDRYLTIARVRANGDLNTPALGNRFEGVFLAGLRKAGMPEE
jgi:adenylate cyclase